MLRAAIICVLILWSFAAISEDGSPRQVDGKAEAAQQNNQKRDSFDAVPAPFPFWMLAKPSPPSVKVYARKNAEDKSQCTEAKNWKEWGAFAWCRSLEWIDTERVIAIFTVILGIATAFLWLATRNLVIGAESTAARQLRAYVSAEPLLVFNFGQAEKTIMIGVDLKNHGPTPAAEIFHDFGMGLAPNPLPDEYVFPIPDRQVDTNHTLFPNAVVAVRFVHDRELSDEEIDDIEKDKRRFHIWGVTHYRDFSGTNRTTKIAASFGGRDFAETTANYRKGKFGPDGKARPGWF